MFAKLSIRAKVTAVVAFLLIAMVGVGLLSVFSMRSINASAVEIRSDMLPSIRLLGELKVQLITYRSILRSHFLELSAEGKDSAENRMDTSSKTVLKIRAD
jgi:methyl-accepting chemotaxis protein